MTFWLGIAYRLYSFQALTFASPIYLTMHDSLSNLEDYLQAHHSPEPPLLAELNRETHLKVLQPRMLSGALQGRFLSLISRLQRPRHILEIGTYTGYSALCLAEGLLPEGELHSLEKNDELEAMIRRYWSRAPQAKQMHLHLGEALKLLPQLQRPWDLVFLDAEKTEYSAYYDALIPLMPSGALLLADNVLWDGKVLAPADPRDQATVALQAFNQQVQSDSRVENILLPLRDGLMLLRRR